MYRLFEKYFLDVVLYSSKLISQACVYFVDSVANRVCKCPLVDNPGWLKWSRFFPWCFMAYRGVNIRVGRQRLWDSEYLDEYVRNISWRAFILANEYFALCESVYALIIASVLSSSSLAWLNLLDSNRGIDIWVGRLCILIKYFLDAL
jgi:hypothetical protein